jgi:hypothetical protein
MRGKAGARDTLRSVWPAIGMPDVVEGATVWLPKSVYDIYVASFLIEL